MDKKLNKSAVFTVLIMAMATGFAGSAFADVNAMDMRSYELVKIDSLATKGAFSKKPDVVDGYLLKAEVQGKAPAVIIRPPCHGLMHPMMEAIRVYDRELAGVLHKAGFTVLMVDGFGPRGETNICKTSARDRKITRGVRIKDTLGALKYLQARKDIEPTKVFLLTFGATGGLSAMNSASSYAKDLEQGFAGAALFYPQCDETERRFAPYSPIQVFVGEKDAWNPARYCKRLAKRKTADSAAFSVKVYPDTYHAFVTKFDPKKVQGPPGVGRVMAGANPEAAADAYKRTVDFFSAIVKG